MKGSNSKTCKKLTRGEEFFCLLFSSAMTYWGYIDITNGYAYGKYETTYYFAEEPVMFCVVLLPKLFLSTYCIYLILKSRFFIKVT